MKVVLALIAIFALVGAVIVNWAPGGESGAKLFRLLAFAPSEHELLLRRFWTVVTSGLLTSPVGVSHALWSLVGLYFVTPDLEKRWGGARLIRFLLLGVIFGNLAVLAGTFLPLGNDSIFKFPYVFGPTGAITATVIAWAKENEHRHFRFMFFLPMSGRTLFWVTIGFAVLSIVFLQGSPEGALAPLGGVASGLLFGGTPSPARALWLRFRLGSMRRRTGGLTVEQLLNEQPSRPRTPKRGANAPPLRIVQGGLEDDLKNRKPPKDKRYLN
jgi:membrane associated rhomboid family serine protease